MNTTKTIDNIEQNTELKWSERRDLKHKKGIFIFHKTFNFN